MATYVPSMFMQYPVHVCHQMGDIIRLTHNLVYHKLILNAAAAT